MTQVERTGSLGHAELDRWLAKDAANCCLFEFSDSDAFLQASIPSIWDPISSHGGEDVMSYFTDANVFGDANPGEMSAVLGHAADHSNQDNHQPLYDHSCSDSEVDDSDTVSSNPDDFVDLAASFLVESDVPGAPAEDSSKQENASEFVVESRPRNSRRKRQLTLEEGVQQDTPLPMVRPFKRQSMVGPIINIYDDALHSSSCTQYYSSPDAAAAAVAEPVNITNANNVEGEQYATQWNHDNFLTPSYSAIDSFCNDEEVESSRTGATTDKECSVPSSSHDPPASFISNANVEQLVSQYQPTDEHSSYLRVC